MKEIYNAIVIQSMRIDRVVAVGKQWQQLKVVKLIRVAIRKLCIQKYTYEKEFIGLEMEFPSVVLILINIIIYYI